MNGRALTALPYGQMVRALMKPMGSFEADLLHAAVGICGEVAELSAAQSIEEVTEELGDICFYVEAAYATLGGRAPEGAIALDPDDPTMHQTLSTLPGAFAIISGDLLDSAKKCWVYGRAVDSDDTRARLLRVEALVHQMCRLVGMRLPDVLGANQAKLGQRYPDLVYTDAAANARADKG